MEKEIFCIDWKWTLILYSKVIYIQQDDTLKTKKGMIDLTTLGAVLTLEDTEMSKYYLYKRISIWNNDSKWKLFNTGTDRERKSSVDQSNFNRQFKRKQNSSEDYL